MYNYVWPADFDVAKSSCFDELRNDVHVKGINSVTSMCPMNMEIVDGTAHVMNIVDAD